MPKPAKKAKTAKDVALLEDTLREAPFVPDEGPGDSLLGLPGGTRSRGVSPGAFAAIKAALEQCAEEVGADFGPEERQWINRIRDGALRRLEPDVAAARREAKRRLLAELAQEAAEERAKIAEQRLQTARARDEVAACRAVAAARIMAGSDIPERPAVPPVTPEEKQTFEGRRRRQAEGRRAGRAADPGPDRVQRGELARRGRGRRRLLHNSSRRSAPRDLSRGTRSRTPSRTGMTDHRGRVCCIWKLCVTFALPRRLLRLAGGSRLALAEPASPVNGCAPPNTRRAVRSVSSRTASRRSSAWRRRPVLRRDNRCATQL